MIHLRPSTSLIAIAALCLAGAIGARYYRPAGLAEADLRPSLPPGTRAKLMYDGFPVPVTVKVQQTGTRENISLIAHGQVLEQEGYESDAKSFRLVSAGGDEFEPGVPLLVFPFRVGDSYLWKGSFIEGGIKRPAVADVTSSEDWIKLVPASVQVIKVNLELSMDGGGKNPAKRRLIFWIKPGGGVIQRDFSLGLKRIPQ